MEAFANMAIDKGKNILNLEDNISTLETKLKRLSCRVSDFKQEVTKAEQTGKKKRKREVENWFEEVEQTENEFNALKNMIQNGGLRGNVYSGDSVAKLNAKVEQLMEQSQHFDGLLLEDHDSRGEPRVTTKLFGDKSQEGLKTVWNWLVTDNLSNIGIYGQGGVGKTTVAKHIHNHLLETTDFNVYWVTVSQEFSIKKLQDDIAKRLNLDLSGEDDVDIRAARLSKSLVQHQSVLILDDVWEEFCPANIGIALGANKCRLILTTRSLQLCHRMQCQRKFNVTSLDTHEAWNLFMYTLGLETVLTPEVKEIAKRVARRCGGLPLGIITVAGSMRGAVDIYEWRTALEQLKSCSVGYKEMEEKVFPILEWSFNRLNGCEKHCFLYCCLYPEDWDIDREELINLFISAELIPRRNHMELEIDHGRTILNKLIKVCLLEETRFFNYRRVYFLDENKDLVGRESVKMHDLIRDMALRITSWKSKRDINSDVPRFLVKSIEAKSNVILEQNEWTQDLNAVSFFRSGSIEIPPDMSPNCQNLSTLLFQYANIERIPDSFFRHMDGLKVVNIRECSCFKELPNCISDMVNLTALLLRDCREIKSVPPLGKLTQLRELNLFRTKIDDIPQGLELLFKLERLNMRGTSLKEITIPKGTFTKLNRLQHLELPPWVHVCDPEVLKQFQVFTGSLALMDVYNEFMTSRCWPKHYNITVVDETSSNDFDSDSDSDFDWDFVINDRNRLDFGRCKFEKGLDVVLVPEDIQLLTLGACFALSDVNLQNLINRSKDLVCLNIKHSSEVEFLVNLSSPHRDDQLVVLPNLLRLSLIDLPNFVGLINSGLSSSSSLSSSVEEAYFGRQHQQLIPPPGIFSSLIQLHISGCHRLKKIFTVQLLLQQSLQNLQRLDVSHCEQLEEMIAANDDDDDVQGVGEEIVSKPSSSSSGATTQVRLPKLRRLCLHDLPQLEIKSKAIIIISDSIEVIWVSYCPKLKRMPVYISINNINTTNVNNGQTSSSSAPPHNTLERIIGSEEWWESLEWDDHNHPHTKLALQPFFESNRISDD